MRFAKKKFAGASVTLLALVSISVVAGVAQESQVGHVKGEAFPHGNLGAAFDRGKPLFRRYCIGCHGPRGDGQGENAPWVDPKPRDFTAGLFKCRSTPSGSIPTDQDIFDAMTRGYVTTNMPAWIPLTVQQRADLVAYIKTFSPRFKQEKPEAPVQITPETPDSPESVARGQKTFQAMKCAECHGQQGRGDGPSAATLRDNKGDPIKPYDFTTGERFKCGVSNPDLFRIFMTGLDGTPMPSFADYLKPEQAWDLVHYLRTLQVNYKGKTMTAKAATNGKKQ